jgi:hypothetical protein
LIVWFRFWCCFWLFMQLMLLFVDPESFLARINQSWNWFEVLFIWYTKAPGYRRVPGTPRGRGGAGGTKTQIMNRRSELSSTVHSGLHYGSIFRLNCMCFVPTFYCGRSSVIRFGHSDIRETWSFRLSFGPTKKIQKLKILVVPTYFDVVIPTK